MRWILVEAVASLVLLGGLYAGTNATKLMDVRPVDDEYLMVYFRDGYVAYRDNGTGPDAFRGGEGQSDTAKVFGTALNTTTAVATATYSLKSTDDAAFGVTGKNPTAVYRKSKVNGVRNNAVDYFLDHWIHLKLPAKMQRGRSYTLEINAGTNTDVTQKTFTFDEFTQVSEAIHVNIIGYYPSESKSADLYMWLGNGGARDYAGYVGKNVIVYDVATQAKVTVGAVSFWKNSGADVGGRNLTKSAVWNCDFSSFKTPGTYRLVVEGVGCSPDFRIAGDVYSEPYKFSLRGYFYMREGQDSTGGIRPVPRRPLWLPGKDPAGFVVYVTTLIPGSADWTSLGSGDNWDVKDWSAFRKPGNPTNPNAWGGWSDACDWDRHEAHVSSIWDILLPYILSGGALREDNLQIAESGNGIPDCIDEARWETDFWLRLRDGAGYSYGINNPGGTVAYQAGTGTIMAWVNAANAAMLAECYRIAGETALMNQYRDSAMVAYTYAASQADQRLDEALAIGDGSIKGRDLKMMAAAYLYNVTGTTSWEDAMKDNCTVTSAASPIDPGTSNQLWGCAAYLKTNRVVHYQTMFDNMRSAIVSEAKQKNANLMASRPSRRATDEAHSWWQSAQAMQRVCVAHAIATSQADKDLLMKALLSEADYGLGRNPMNAVQMSGLGSRHPEDMYTTGQNDGTPGVHPGHTPYMNAEDWGSGWWGGMPSFMHSKGYPAWTDWPHGEALWPVRYNYANSEFTPQQTMRGKVCLLGYMHSLSAGITGVAAGGRGVRSSVNVGSIELVVGSQRHRVLLTDDVDQAVLVALNGRVVAVRNLHRNGAAFPRVSEGVYLVRLVKNGRQSASRWVGIQQ